LVITWLLLGLLACGTQLRTICMSAIFETSPASHTSKKQATTKQ
jgi:hypothetical protein